MSVDRQARGFAGSTSSMQCCGVDAIPARKAYPHDSAASVIGVRTVLAKRVLGRELMPATTVRLAGVLSEVAIPSEHVLSRRHNV